MGDTRFDSDLLPNALPSMYFKDGMWKAEISKLDFGEMEQLLSFYRSKEAQRALLQWVQEMDNKFTPKKDFFKDDDLPF